MKTVTVSASKTYQIHICTDLIPQIGEHIANLAKGKKVMILSDSNVWPLYGKTVCKSLHQCGFTVIQYIIPAGEASKSGENYLKILNFLAENQLTRADSIVALGGGVVGDLAGFVAATYLRGIAFIQVPTSLLAMVDSSVGGKTAIDLQAGKNLAGAFYQPSLVLCDLDALKTLPADVFNDGCAEVIKYAILFDSELFLHLETYGLDFDREYVISRCVVLKRDIVNRDERDLGERQLLNLGHTIGHSIETNSAYVVSHGKAVAIGTQIVTAGAAAEGICSADTLPKVTRILKQFGLPTETAFDSHALAEAALRDKKRANDTISLILPKRIGECFIYPYPIKDLESFIKAGLAYGNQSNPR